MQTGAPARPPNVVVVLADDLGYGELGCYGQEKIRTPHVDRMAAEGVRFTRFYSPSTVCAPTRASLLTGKHTGHTPVRGNREVGGWGFNEGEGQFTLPASETTLAEALKAAGYATACVGKWGLGAPGSEGRPTNQGIDYFFGYNCQRQAHNYTPTHLWENDVVYQLDNPYFKAHQKLEQAPADYSAYLGPQYSPYLMIDKAEQWIKVNKSKPFFLYFASPLPHGAIQAPQELVDRYPREWDQEPYLGQNGYLPNERPRAAYAAMISYLDESLGRLMKTVQDLGLEKDTIFVFLSDNGPAPNAGVDKPFFGSTGGLRGMKTNLYEAGIRVPFVASWPGKITGGRVVDTLSAGYDLFPTILELAGVRRPGGLDGLSLAPTLLGTSVQAGHEALYFEYPEGRKQQAVVTRTHKMIRPDLTGSPERFELYDLDADPRESKDLSASAPELLARLQDIAKREHIPSADFPIPALDGGAPTLIDLASERWRQVTVDRQPGQYLGHVSTLLLEDGKTILAVYPQGHGRGPIVYKRSDDGGKTWSGRLDTPANWSTSLETPTIHRAIDPKTGKKRLVVWSGLYPARTSVSEDDGKTWTPLQPVGDWGGIVVMGSVERLKDGRYLAMFHDDGRFFRKEGKATGVFTLYQTLSSDGGLTWSEPRTLWSGSDVHLCEPGVFRTPDGRLVALLRENRRVKGSHLMVSSDEGATWSTPRELPWSLTGDRHTAKYAPDGRLVVSLRDMARGSATWGDWVAWVGTWEDVLEGRQGQYRVRLMDNLSGSDCAYPGVEVLPDGTFVFTTYGTWVEGAEPFISSVTVTLVEFDQRTKD